VGVRACAPSLVVLPNGKLLELPCSRYATLIHTLGYNPHPTRPDRHIPNVCYHAKMVQFG
jgi:hypothetical protein